MERMIGTTQSLLLTFSLLVAAFFPSTRAQESWCGFQLLAEYVNQRSAIGLLRRPFADLDCTLGAAREREMMANQMKLAGNQYSDGVDFNRYNFVLGIAASTNPYIDLGTRVVFDELTNGKFTVDEQSAYDSLKDRQFDELACHSNGAMVCLAALENKDIIADHVVLYGPQVTIESLELWDELVRSGRVKPVQIYIDRSDPVPPVSLLTGGRLIGTVALSSLAMFKLPTMNRIINETSPRLTVQTFSCGDGTPTLDCHAMTAYKARINYKPKPSQQTVPETKLHGVGVVEPPSPN